MAAAMPDPYIWALSAIFIFWLSNHYRFGRNHWRQALLLHVPTSLVIAALNIFIGVSIIPLFQPIPSHSWWWRSMKFNFFNLFHWNVLAYWAIVACNHALHYYRSYREKEIRTSQLETQLAEAQLQALKMQLQPHFLFNTLHSISALIHKDPEAADKMITRLGDFLRITLDNAGTQEVTLQKELEFIRSYLEIERIRFQDRMRVSLNIDPETLDGLVPNLLWQPVLENAIRHGIAARSESGSIEIGARRISGRLQLSIKDNGPGIQIGQNTTGLPNERVGLANTRARLRQLYGEDHSLQLRNATTGGLEVIMEIPFRRQSNLSNVPAGAASTA
jgi:signal transduction histidine kinase